MQRNITYQDVVESFFLFLAFVLYESLTSIYLLLPPLFALLFVYFVYALDHNEYPKLFLVSVMLLVFEADKDYILLSSIIYSFFAYFFIIPKIRQFVNCRSCYSFIYSILAYFGFWMFNSVLAKVFWFLPPELDWYMPYYILVEFLIISVIL
ncbi:MAG: hypothetical protein GQ570_02435 [Helicobacteraceae bacterium]|nr:hypothetical protein [Helicobacteraceae bacterium]